MAGIGKPGRRKKLPPSEVELLHGLLDHRDRLRAQMAALSLKSMAEKFEVGESTLAEYIAQYARQKHIQPQSV